MEDQSQARPPDPNIPGHSSERTETVRSRWSPKPEQILILESIFNSGMVNPPKDETVRIRKLLEKFGSVGDANVFYWFQNRRSRSRRRQRLLQAQAQLATTAAGSAIQLENSCSAPAAPTMGFFPAASCSPPPAFGSSSSSPSFLVGSSSSSPSCGGGNGVENLFSMPAPMGFQETGQCSSILCPSESQNLHYQSADLITVFINGAATVVPRGPLDIKAMFGQDVMLVHSSGLPLPINDFGFLPHTLQHGESYFLVSRGS